MKKLLSEIALVFLLLFSSGGCSKQKAPNVGDGDVYRDVSRLEACKLLSVNRDFFLLTNVKMLFKCTDWSVKFPNLNNALYSIQEKNWNLIFSPINNYYFNDRKKRDTFIGIIKKYDTDEFWEEFNKILVSLNENNFYDIFSKILDCAISNSHECLNSNVSEKTIADILELLKIDQKTLRGFLAIAAEWLDDKQSNPELYKKVHAHEEYLKIRKEALRHFFYYVKNGLNDKEHDFLKASFKSTSDYALPAREFFKILGSGGETFLKEINFYHGINAVYKKKVQAIVKMYREGVKCEANGEAVFGFDVKKIFDEFHEKLFELDRVEFQKYFVGKYLETKYSFEMCPNLQKIEFAPNEYFSFVDFYEETKLFFESEKHFLLMKSVLDKKDASGFPLYYNVENYGLLEILMKYMENAYKLDVEYAENMVSRIVSKGDEYYLRFYEVIYNNYLSKNKNKLKALEKIWDFLDKKDHDFIFKIIDKHYATYIPANKYYHLYTDIVEVLSDKWDSAIFDIYRNGISPLIVSLSNIAKSFKSRELLEDFKKFYSREHLLRVLELVSDLSDIRKTISLLKETVQKLTQTKLKKITFAPDLVMPCFDGSVKSTKNVFDFVNNTNPDCYKEGRSLMPSLFRGFKDLHREIKIYNPEIKFSDDGAFSNDFGRDVFVFAKHLDNSLKIKNERLGDYVFNDNRYYDGSVIGPLGKYLDQILNETKSPKVDLFVDRILASFLNMFNKKNAANFLDATNVFIEKISQKDFSSPLPPITDCNKLSHYYSSGISCPTIDYFFNNILQEALKYLLRKNETNLSPLYLILKMFQAGGGHVITTDSGKKFKARLSTRESLDMTLKFSNKRYKINNIKVPYYDSDGDIVLEQSLTTLERIEATLRDVDFTNNYLGVQYKNYVVYGDSYNEDVKSKKKEMNTCLKTPIVRCGKKMSKSERFKARNALETYDGLLDANNGRGLEKDFKFANYMKSLLGAVVESSTKDARKVRFIPLSYEVLNGHNGRLLSVFSKVHGLNHLAYYISSFGIDSYSSFDFLGDFDDLVLKNEDINKLSVSLEKLLRLVGGDFKKFLRLVDFVEKDTGRYFEKSLLYIIKHSRLIGSDDGHYVTDEYYKLRYKNNHLDYLLNILIGAYESTEDLSNMLKNIDWKNVSILLETFDEMASSDNREERFGAYILINEIIYLTLESLEIAENIWQRYPNELVRDFINYSKNHRLTALSHVNKILDFLVSERSELYYSLKNVLEALREPRTIDLLDNLVKKLEFSIGENNRPGEMTYALKALVGKELGLENIFKKAWGAPQDRIEENINTVLEQIYLSDL